MKPALVYKGPFANRKLRGQNIRAIGDDRLCDAPMMLERDMRILQMNANRLQVRGVARVEEGGAATDMAMRTG